MPFVRRLTRGRASSVLALLLFASALLTPLLAHAAASGAPCPAMAVAQDAHGHDTDRHDDSGRDMPLAGHSAPSCCAFACFSHAFAPTAGALAPPPDHRLARDPIVAHHLVAADPRGLDPPPRAPV